MQDCLIKPIKLTEEEKVKLEQTMAECHQVLLNEASTLEERISTRRLRDEYRRGDREVSAEAQDALHILRSLEDRVLSGYILVGHKQSRKLFSAEERPGILIDDFHQEVAILPSAESEVFDFIIFVTLKSLLGLSILFLYAISPKSYAFFNSFSVVVSLGL